MAQPPGWANSWYLRRDTSRSRQAQSTMTSLLLFFVFDVCGAADLQCSGLIGTTVSITTTPDSVPLQSVSSCDSVTQMPQGNAHTATLDNATQAFNGLHGVAGCSSKADAACAINAHNAHYRLKLTRAPILSLVVIISISVGGSECLRCNKALGQWQCQTDQAACTTSR